MPTGIYKRTPEMYATRRGRPGYWKNKKFSKKHRDNIGKGNKGNITWTKDKFGENHPRWKDGRYKNIRGYIEIYQFNHPFKNYKHHVLEHRLVMEKHLGRYLTPEEIVHHRGIKYPINSIENRSDNRLINLQLFANDIEHRKFHRLNPLAK